MSQNDTSTKLDNCDIKQKPTDRFSGGMSAVVSFMFL